MFSIFTWRCYYKWWKSLSPTLEMIEKMSLGWILSWALDMCGLGPLIQLIIIFYYFIFELVNLYTAVISEIVFQFEVTYIFIVPHSWKWTFQKNSPSENILCIHFVSKREKETLSSSQNTTLCASFSCCRSFYPERQTSISLKAPQWLCEGRNLL